MFKLGETRQIFENLATLQTYKTIEMFLNQRKKWVF